MHNVVISGTGLYTPAQSISNEELVESFNTYVAAFNQDNAAAIERGDIDPSFVITHFMMLDEAPQGYEKFRDKQDGCIKIVLKPGS